MSKKKRLTAQSQPTKETFVEFARQNSWDVTRAADQWDIWDAGDWCDGQGNPILNWKLKLATFAKLNYGMFSQNFAPGHWDQRRQLQKRDRDRAAESLEEYEQRQRYKPDNL